MSELYECPYCAGTLNKEAAIAAQFGQVDVYVDWFGDGLIHDSADFPAPEPFTRHGTIWTNRATGNEVHRCGTFALTMAVLKS